jgi:arginine/lysine/ornithine decarboxylase
LSDQQNAFYLEAQALVKSLLDKREFVLPLFDVISLQKESLPMRDCIGRISAQFKSVCPPGYPVLIYGERIHEEHVKLLGES